MSEERPTRGHAAGTGGEEPTRERAGVDGGRLTRKRAAVSVGKRPSPKRAAGADGKKPTRERAAAKDDENPLREVVAGAGEGLEYLTCVLRGEADGELKNPTARMKAAELLGKRMGLFEEGAEAAAEPVVIVDDIRPPEEGAEAASIAGGARGPEEKAAREAGDVVHGICPPPGD